MTANHRGFSLLEMIAVMAIVSILAASLAPNIFRAINDARAEAESATLATLGDSLRTYILETQRIPSPNVADWTAALAQVSDHPQARIQLNDRDFTRRLYFDPLFLTNTPTSFTGFTQNRGLTARPVSPRVMIVSNLEANLPNPPTTAAAFNAIWDQTNTATVVESKTIKIERINLARLFHRVVLSNANTVSATYALEAGDAGTVPGRVGTIDGETERYVLHGSKLNLRGAPFPSSDILRAQIVNSPVSHRYQADTSGTVWSWVQS